MKMIIEHLGNRILVEDEEAHDITDAFDLMEQALLQIGFEPARIRAGFAYKAEEFKKHQ